MSHNEVEKNLEKNKFYNKKIVKISDAEIEMHSEFLKKELKKNYY